MADICSFVQAGRGSPAHQTHQQRSNPKLHYKILMKQCVTITIDFSWTAHDLEQTSLFSTRSALAMIPPLLLILVIELTQVP
jgi:hypothetical protein